MKKTILPVVILATVLVALALAGSVPVTVHGSSPAPVSVELSGELVNPPDKAITGQLICFWLKFEADVDPSMIEWHCTSPKGAIVTFEPIQDYRRKADGTGYIKYKAFFDAMNPGLYHISVAACKDNALVHKVHTIDVSTNGPIPPPVQSLIVSPSALSVPEGSNASFVVSLSSQPTTDITVSIAKSGDTDISASPAILVFNSANYSIPQGIVVTAGQDTDITNGVATIVVSSQGLTSQTVVATEVDDDTTPPPPPDTKWQVAFFYDSHKLDNLPMDQLELVAGRVLRGELEAKGHLYLGGFDLNSASKANCGPNGCSPSKAISADLVPWFNAAKSQGVPCMLIAPRKGGDIKSFPMPANKSEMFSKLEIQ